MVEKPGEVSGWPVIRANSPDVGKRKISHRGVQVLRVAVDPHRLACWARIVSAVLAACSARVGSVWWIVKFAVSRTCQTTGTCAAAGAAQVKARLHSRPRGLVPQGPGQRPDRSRCPGLGPRAGVALRRAKEDPGVARQLVTGQGRPPSFASVAIGPEAWETEMAGCRRETSPGPLAAPAGPTRGLLVAHRRHGFAGIRRTSCLESVFECFGLLARSGPSRGLTGGGR